jgi:hypothetical protein
MTSSIILDGMVETLFLPLIILFGVMVSNCCIRGTATFLCLLPYQLKSIDVIMFSTWMLFQ